MRKKPSINLKAVKEKDIKRFGVKKIDYLEIYNLKYT